MNGRWIARRPLPVLKAERSKLPRRLTASERPKDENEAASGKFPCSELLKLEKSNKANYLNFRLHFGSTIEPNGTFLPHSPSFFLKCFKLNRLIQLERPLSTLSSSTWLLFPKFSFNSVTQPRLNQVLNTRTDLKLSNFGSRPPLQSLFLPTCKSS